MQTKVKVIEIRQETLSVVSLKVEKPEGFTFKPGQFCMIILNTQEGKQTKSFSIASAPEDDFLLFATKDTGSAFKEAWKALKAGQEIEINGAFGMFVLQEDKPVHVFLSGGIGVTPLLSMAKHAQAKKLPLHIFFMYSNKEAQDIPFKQALDALQTESIQITHTLTREEGTAWKGRKGRVNAEMIQELVPEWGKAIYYLCGPQKMVDALRQVLEELGIQKENVQFENFTGY